MQNEPTWLPLERVITINRDTVAVTNEPFQILDLGLVESGLHKARNHFEYNPTSDLAELTVSIVTGTFPSRQGKLWRLLLFTFPIGSPHVAAPQSTKLPWHVGASTFACEPVLFQELAAE